MYLYDIENRLVESHVQGAGNSNCAALSYSGALQSAMRYDPMGRLYETNGPSGITRFLIDGDAMVAEYSSTGVLQQRYVHGADGKTDDPVAWYAGGTVNSSALRLLYANHQGSIVSTVDTAGNATRLFRYDDYGITEAQGDVALTPANGARFGYTGLAWLSDLGLYYYKARMYSPFLGRFMQTDPIGYNDQINLYAYVGNDPVNGTDPTGKFGRGSGFSDDEWKLFDQIQQRAAADMVKRAAKLDAKAAQLDAKGKASKADSARSRAGSLRQGAIDLKGTSKTAVSVSASQYRAIGGAKDGAARAIIGGSTMWVNKDHPSWSGSDTVQMRWNVGHESLHTGAKITDRVASAGGALAYKNSTDAAHRALFNSIRGTPEADRNPDHIMDEVY